MESALDSTLDYHTAYALLEWQVELGVTEAMMDAPADRYETPAVAPKIKPAPVAAAPLAIVQDVDGVAVAKKCAKAATDLAGLEAAIRGFEHCELKRGARGLVLADGNPAARVMIIGEPPDRDEDRAGKPFVGAAGNLLDNMLAAIDMGRDVALSKDAVYLSTVVPWRLPQNSTPRPEDLLMMRPFLDRHIEIVAPDVIVLMGNICCRALLGKGVNRARGQWHEMFAKPVLAMAHPAQLLRQPAGKREAWADLLMLKAKLETMA